MPDGTVLGCNRRCNREKSSSRLSNEIWSHAFGEVNEKFPWTSALHFQTQPDNQCSVSVTGDNCEGNLCLLPALKCLPTPSIQSKNESYCVNTPVVKVCTSRVIARIHVISRAMPIVPAKQRSYRQGFCLAEVSFKTCLKAGFHSRVPFLFAMAVAEERRRSSCRRATVF